MGSGWNRGGPAHRQPLALARQPKVAPAAAQDADIAAKDFRLSRRPAVVISWSAPCTDAAGPDPGVIEGIVREIGGGAAILHDIRTRFIGIETGELVVPDAAGFSRERWDLNELLRGGPPHTQVRADD